MKPIMKYSKWVLASAVVLATPAFTSCSDDDDEPAIQVPQTFEMNLANLNIAWDETEGVVELAANDKWKAESNSPWITIDPSRGNAGDFRMYFIFEPNPYRLPRTGMVEVTCGEKNGVVKVTQAGCSDDSKVAPSVANIEVESLDYATSELSFATWASEIEGNLGISLAQFGQGVDDEGELEFFMVDNEGKWLKTGTAGTRCSAWLDSNLNVTNWNGGGYPANACFIEVYGGEDPTLVIGRAPGVPENTEYTLNFGFTFANDHSKYLLCKVNVVFPKMVLTGEVVGTIDLTADIAPVGYSPVYIPFDAQQVCSLLGAGSIYLTKVVAYDADGEFVPYTGGNGYWFDTHGAICNWGDGAGWFIEYHGNESEPDPAVDNAWAVGTFPGVTDIAGTSKIGLWYNAKVVMFNMNVKVSGAVPEE